MAAFASCATNDDAQLSRATRTTPRLPEASAPDDQVDASEDVPIVDAGYDAADTDVHHVVTLQAKSIGAGVESGVNPLYILKARLGIGQERRLGRRFGRFGHALRRHDVDRDSHGNQEHVRGRLGQRSERRLRRSAAAATSSFTRRGPGDGTASILDVDTGTRRGRSRHGPLYAIWGTSASDVRASPRVRTTFRA